MKPPPDEAQDQNAPRRFPDRAPAVIATEQEKLDRERAAAGEIGRAAVSQALAQKAPEGREQLAEEKQRNADHALADAVEIVARQRARLGRRVCSGHDGTTIRKIHELLRAMGESHAELADHGFPA